MSTSLWRAFALGTLPGACCCVVSLFTIIARRIDFVILAVRSQPPLPRARFVKRPRRRWKNNGDGLPPILGRERRDDSGQEKLVEASSLGEASVAAEQMQLAWGNDVSGRPGVTGNTENDSGNKTCFVPNSVCVYQVLRNASPLAHLLHVHFMKRR